MFTKYSTSNENLAKKEEVVKYDRHTYVTLN